MAGAMTTDTDSGRGAPGEAAGEGRPACWQRVGLIGTGRVARALLRALQPHSAAPPLLWGRTPERVREALRPYGAAAVEAGGYDALWTACDAIGIAVADDALPAVVAALAQAAARGPTRPGGGPFLFHVSGASGTAPLAPARACGAVVAAVHPAMTFTGDAPAEVARMAGARFAITADSDAARAQAVRLVAHLGGVAAFVPEDRRALYHAALSHAANHLVTLMAGAAQALQAAGVDEPMPLLAPLVRAALDNSLERGFDALSGPVLRGDADTVRAHGQVLAAHCPAVQPAYRAMARATLEELERRGQARNAPALRAVLD